VLLSLVSLLWHRGVNAEKLKAPPFCNLARCLRGCGKIA
jgi:hypothetical protein